MTDFINIFLPPDKISLKVGLFFGSFNPVHIGHMAIANYITEFAGLKQVWFVVSPQNPFKKREDLLNDIDRYEMVLKAIGDDPGSVSPTSNSGCPNPPTPSTR